LPQYNAGASRSVGTTEKKEIFALTEVSPKKPFVTRKSVVSVLLTLLLGPGIGHLYLKYFRQGIYLIAASLVFALHQAWKVLSVVAKEDRSKLSYQDMTMLFQKFAVNYPKTMLYYDIIFAAIWAYALVDVFNKGRKE
jgi:hypothetical protein